MTWTATERIPSLVSSGGAASIVQTRFAEYGQLVPGKGQVVWAIHISKELDIAAQAAWDWIPGRGRYPFGHCSLEARVCLNIPYARN